jgi:hypothetical protein
LTPFCPLERDPEEKVNLADNPEYAPVLKRMQRILAEQIEKQDRPFGEF